MDCTWNSPGANPYMGTVAQAVERYNLPQPVQAELVAKAQAHRYEAVVTITRDGIEGGFEGMRDMHFGRNTVCSGPVKRTAWPASHIERAFVYCAGEHCIAVPFICRNVSLITRTPPPAEPKAFALPIELPIETPLVEVPLIDLGDPSMVPSLPIEPATFAQGGSFALAAPFAPLAFPQAAPIPAVPEPSTWALLALGLGAIAARRKK